MKDDDGSTLAETLEGVIRSVEAVVIGQPGAVRLLVVTILSGGHALLEGVPGVAKTLLVRILASRLGLRFGRVQCTPDLMPSDVIGTPVFRPGPGEFEFRRGPVFADLLLVDEINRAPAKTQSAFLEAMQEHAVTVDGNRHSLGEWFTVLATQNPIEQEGTYPLPEAELDRFLCKVLLHYPERDDEISIITTHHETDPTASGEAPLVGPGDLARARQIVRDTIVRPEIVGYAVDVARATRDDPSIAVGVSPRASVWLIRAAKGFARLSGRDFVLPEDVQEAVFPVFRHRLILEAGAEVEGTTPDDALRSVLRAVPVPH